nr:hypothetical protein TEA_001105 [Ipomoea batatas]
MVFSDQCQNRSHKPKAELQFLPEAKALVSSRSSGSTERRRFVEPSCRAREEEAQAQASRAVSQLFLHGAFSFTLDLFLCFVLLKMSSAKAALTFTRRQLWCVGTARQCCASRLVGVPGSLRDALSGERVTNNQTVVLFLFEV